MRNSSEKHGKSKKVKRDRSHRSSKAGAQNPKHVTSAESDSPEAAAAGFVRHARKAPVKAIVALRRSVRDLIKGHRRQLWARAAGAFAGADEMKMDAMHWKKFRNEQFWSDREDRPMMRDQEKALKSVIDYVFESAGYKRRKQYLRALEYLEQKGVAPEDVFEKIVEAGGLEKLAKLAVHETPRQAKRATSKLKKALGPTKVQVEVDDEDEGHVATDWRNDSDDWRNEDEDADDDDLPTEGKRRPMNPRPGFVHLPIEVDEETFEAVLAAENSVTMRLTTEVGVNGYYRVRGSLQALN